MIKTLKLIVIVLLFIVSSAKADVIYSPFTEIGTALSLEGIASYELPFSNANTLNVWGGGGVVTTIFYPLHPAVGGEIALELRQYFTKKTYEKFTLGFYTGIAVIHAPSFYRGKVARHKNSIGLVPGVKLTYKKRINSWLVGEPYLSVSTPWYDDNFQLLTNRIKSSDPGFIITLGIRIGLNKIQPMKFLNKTTK